jgi:hypothetical protein
MHDNGERGADNHENCVPVTDLCSSQCENLKVQLTKKMRGIWWNSDRLWDPQKYCTIHKAVMENKLDVIVIPVTGTSYFSPLFHKHLSRG